MANLSDRLSRGELAILRFLYVGHRKADGVPASIWEIAAGIGTAKTVVGYHLYRKKGMRGGTGGRITRRSLLDRRLVARRNQGRVFGFVITEKGRKLLEAKAW